MSDVKWSTPSALWLLWLLPVLVALALYAHGRVRAAAGRFASERMRARLMPALGTGGVVAKTALLVAGLGLCIVALAGPAWDVYYVKIRARGLDLVVALDVSRSMLADDGGESRLDRARSAISWLVDDLEGDRVGLLLFAGEVATTCPLTLDRAFFQQALREADPQAVGRGGTRIGPALDEGERMLDASSDRDKVLLLVTDGDDQDTFPLRAAERLAKRRVRVITLGIGRQRGSDPLVLDGQIVRRKDGQPVLARLNEELLKEIAVKTQGMYVPPEESQRLAELYRRYIDPLQKGESGEMQEKHYHARFQWFLLPGILLLLMQAGRGPYRRRREETRNTGAAVAALLGAMLLILGGCGETGDAAAVRAAMEALRAGEAASCVTRLREVEAERPDDPIVAYDLGCAYQALESEHEARDAYYRAIESGDKDLRARARFNLALLDLARLRELADDQPETLRGDERTELRTRAGAALDHLQVARQLDPGLTEATEVQDAVARWLRVQEDRWAAADLEREREKLRQLQGARFLMGVIEAERQLAADLGGGDLLENLALRQRALREDLPLAKEKLGDEAPAPPKSLVAEIETGIDAAGPELEVVEAHLKEARLPEASQALLAVVDELVSVWLDWSEIGDGLAEVLKAQRQLVGSVAEWVEQEGGESVSPQSRLLAEVAERRLAWIDKLACRVEEQNVDPAWHPLFVEEARTGLETVRSSMEEAVTALREEPRRADAPLRAAAVVLERLLEDWRLSRMEAAELARTLELEQREIHLQAAAADPLQAAFAGGAPLDQRERELLRRLGYADRALEQAGAPPGEGAPEAAVQQHEQLVKALLQVKERAVAAGAKALEEWKKGGWPPSEECVAAMAEGRSALRVLWLSLAAFEKLLEGAAGEEAALIALNGKAREILGSDADPAPPLAGPFLPSLQREEQRVTTALVQELAERAPQEAERLRAQATAVDAETPAPGAPPPGQLEEMVTAYEAIAPLLTDAASSAVAADHAFERMAGLGAKAEIAAALEAVAEHQQRTAELLQEALRRLAEARLTLPQLAQRIMSGEKPVARLLRELAAGRKVEKEDGTALAIADVVPAQAEVGAYVERLPRALDATLEQMAGAGAGPDAGAADPQAEERRKQAEGALRAMVARAGRGHQEATAALGEEKARDALRGAGDALFAARALWAMLSDFQEVLKGAVAEETEAIATSDRFSAEVDEVARDLREAAAAEQEATRALIPPLEMQVQTLRQQQAQQAAQGQGGAPSGSATSGGGLSPEVLELAEKNLPKASAAMKEAIARLGAAEWAAANLHQQKAKRYLEEILEAIEEQQDQEQEQEQPQPQPQPEQQDPQMSPEELERLQQLVKERNQREPETEHRKRSPVEEDW